jgi:tetratricopeptide (TPR) repeat protein
VERLRRDVDLLKKLEEASLQVAAAGAVAWDFAGADRLYLEAFQGYDLDVTALDPQEAAGRVRASAVGDRLTAGLDDWAFIRDKVTDGSGAAPRTVADLVDGDPWRRRLRGAAGRRAVLEGLAEEEGALGQPPTHLVLLVRALKDAGGRAAAARLLRGVQAEHPGDFWINFALARSFDEELDAADRIRFYQAALALRPHSPVVHNNLAKTLMDKGDVDGSLAECRLAIRLKGDYATAHNNLGIALWRKGRPDEAIAAFREALRIKKDFAGAHNNLGIALKDTGQLDEAIAAYREALRLKPDHFPGHINLGIALALKGRPDEAVAAFREALRLKDDDPEAHCNLGKCLLELGRFRQAAAELRRGCELGSRNPGWPHARAAQAHLGEAEQMARLVDRLPDVLGGKDRPRDAAEHLGFARLCQRYRKQYAAAARLYEEAFAAQPDLVASPDNGLRYNAACAAALAGCGAGGDPAPLTDAERAGLRKQALDWLRADLGASHGLLDKGRDQDRSAVAQRMQHSLADSDFLGVRGPEALGKLPEAEREGWRQLWADVAATLARAQEKGRPETKAVAPAAGPKRD